MSNITYFVLYNKKRKKERLKGGGGMQFEKYLKGEKGLTLVEILASLTILGIITIGTINYFSQAYFYTNMNEKKTAAVNVARNALMYMEKQNFIMMKDRFEKNADEQLTLLICSDEGGEKYRFFGKDEKIDSNCKQIRINNIDYDVTISSSIDTDYDSFIIPLTVDVHWEINKKDFQTTLEGVIKSEDIR